MCPPDSGSFSDKVAFVTGANRGLGWETARELGLLGIHVVLGIRDFSKAEDALARLRKVGVSSAEALAFELDKAADHDKAAAFFNEKWGRLDILVNNAAVFIKQRSEAAVEQVPTSEVSMDALRSTFETNFFSTIALTQKLLPLIRKAPAGRIVNVSSRLGSLTLHSDPHSSIFGHQALAYDASKTALNSFTVHLATELRDTAIKVNSAHPGWVKTDMGGQAATLELAEGGKTSVQLATLPADGPTGGFFHLGEKVPW